MGLRARGELRHARERDAEDVVRLLLEPGAIVLLDASQDQREPVEAVDHRLAAQPLTGDRRRQRVHHALGRAGQRSIDRARVEAPVLRLRHLRDQLAELRVDLGESQERSHQVRAAVTVLLGAELPGDDVEPVERVTLKTPYRLRQSSDGFPVF